MLVVLTKFKRWVNDWFFPLLIIAIIMILVSMGLAMQVCIIEETPSFSGTIIDIDYERYGTHVEIKLTNDYNDEHCSVGDLRFKLSNKMEHYILTGHTYDFYYMKGLCGTALGYHAVKICFD